MYDDSLEQLVLSGALFNGGTGDQSPRNHSPSSSRPNSPPPITFEDDEGSASNYVGASEHHIASNADAEGHESIGLGPGRTGVKGVIRDRDEAREREKEKGRKQMNDLAAKQAKLDLSAATYFDELDREASSKAREGDAWGGVEEWRRRRLEELKTATTTKGGGAYGHLREVGVGGFVEAVEKVPRDVWVVLHIYDPSLNRCVILDSHLSVLARRYPTVKFLRARAGAIGFATISSSAGAPNAGTRTTRTSRDPEDSDSEPEMGGQSNFIGRLEDKDEEEEEDEWEAEPDYDVLPTVLVYRGGELVFSWPRVDWEITNAAGKGGGVGGGVNALEVRDVEDLLIKYHIIQPSSEKGPGDPTDEDDHEELEFASDVA